MAKAKKQKRDIQAEVTAKIVAALQEGRAPWVKPWDGKRSRALNPLSGTMYRGINTMLLSMGMMSQGFGYSRWMTFNQVRELTMDMMAKDLGRDVMKGAPKGKLKEGFKGKMAYAGWLKEQLTEAGLDPDAYPHVAKGSKGEMVVFQKVIDVEKKDKEGNVERDAEGKAKMWSKFICNQFTVFNSEQIANLPEIIAKGEEIPEPAFQLDQDMVDALLGALPGLELRMGGVDAYYQMASDTIGMPEVGRFKDQGAYFATILHEAVHATRHPDRLGRSSGVFGSPEYAREELIAEIGSAYLCAHLGIDGFLQHPEYVNNWIKALENDKREIFIAAGRAQKACDFILKGMGLDQEEDVPSSQAKQA